MENTKPEKKFRAGSISASIWLNEGQNNKGEPTEYRTISLQRGYKDKEGQWQNCTSFRIGDLPKARVLLQKAYEHLLFNQPEAQSSEQTLKGESL